MSPALGICLRRVSKPDAQSDMDRMLKELGDPDLLSQRIDELPDDVRKYFTDLHEAIVEMPELLIDASDRIRTVETRVPGGETARARQELEKQIQELISTVEKLK